MRLSRRHLLLSTLALGSTPLLRSTRVAPEPEPSDPAVAGSGLAALAVRVAPLDWRGVFAGDAAATGVAYVSESK